MASWANVAVDKPKGIRRNRILLIMSVQFLFEVSKSFTGNNTMEEMHHIFFE
jgi:hypothetical protein